MKLQYLTRKHGQGPFYLASGFRPSGIACLVNVQVEGQVMPATYYSTSDTFRDVMMCRIDPECWSFLPPVYANTEREWWMGLSWKIDYEWQEESFMCYTYKSDGALTAPNLCALGEFETLDAAKNAAYDHWVSVGRPLIQNS